MKIVVAVRCRNEEENISRFLRGYDFADLIVVSDGGSTDNSVELLKQSPKVKLFHFDEEETVNGQTWNPDASHINFVLHMAKYYEPDWLIFDDMDCVPTAALKHQARRLLGECNQLQMNVFRLYLWGDDRFFPHMNRHFLPEYKSLWAWRPEVLNVHANPNVRHGTIDGISSVYCGLDIPYCLLHKSWNPETIDKKVERYNALGLEMHHPLQFAGEHTHLPEWAYED